ncbi:MAG TPA: hypothetical protein VF648_09540 [Pyrinomonadaceae bacterium]|jgi:hypothetical protein
MNLQVWTGYWLYFLVPIILFVGCFLFIRRGEGVIAKASAFIAGSDNRLSLSRLQALVWSLVIYGSFFAAMAVHNVIPPASASQAEEYTAAAADAKEKLPSLKEDVKKAETDKVAAEEAKINAESEYSEADSNLKTLMERKAPEAEINTAKTQLTAAQDKLNTKARLLTLAQQKLSNAEGKVKAANEDIRMGRNFNWVEIPGELLALAGIAIGSGIFSSLISALNSEEKTACVTSIHPISAVEFNDETKYPDTPETTSPYLLKINGKDMDKTGKVRFGINKVMTTYASILYWKSNGTEIVVDVPTNRSFDTLVVDTPNGKLSYKLDDDFRVNEFRTNLEAANRLLNQYSKSNVDTIADLEKAKENLEKLTKESADEAKIGEANSALQNAEREVAISETNLTEARDKVKEIENSRIKNLRLGVSKYFYEFSDLFRDDKNPSTMDLMKFQMFGWTVIAIFIYSWLFLSNITKDIASLPLVPPSIVLLTGLSQAGYLAGKGISNVQSNQQNQGTTS